MGAFDIARAKDEIVVVLVVAAAGTSVDCAIVLVVGCGVVATPPEKSGYGSAAITTAATVMENSDAVATSRSEASICLIGRRRYLIIAPKGEWSESTGCKLQILS